VTDVGLEALELYDVPTVARLLRLSRATIYRLIADGELDSVKIGAARRVAPEAIARFKQNLAQAAQADKAAGAA
jgi:excisionase family DNA binding protein